MMRSSKEIPIGGDAAPKTSSTLFSKTMSLFTFPFLRTSRKNCVECPPDFEHPVTSTDFYQSQSSKGNRLTSDVAQESNMGQIENNRSIRTSKNTKLATISSSSSSSSDTKESAAVQIHRKINNNKVEYQTGSSSWNTTNMLSSLSPFSSSSSSVPSSSSSSSAPSSSSSSRTSSSTTTTRLPSTTVIPTKKNGVLCCDKCDGKHETDNCPYYKKARDDHIDAAKNGWKLVGGTSSLPGAVLRSARVVTQPGDGSCLFHSMSYGIKDGSTANSLRREICEYIHANPATPICETPLSDWVKWDSGISCAEYARKMSRGCWGGGIEMACMSRMKGCNVHVYEKNRTGGFKRISAFDHPHKPEQRKIVRVLYRGGVHYDAIAD